MAATLNDVVYSALTDEGGNIIPWENEPTTQAILIAGTKRQRGSQGIGNGSYENLNRGEVAIVDGCWLIVRNRSTTPAETIWLQASGAAAPFGFVSPGKTGRFQLAAMADLQARSASGVPILDYWLFDV